MSDFPQYLKEYRAEEERVRKMHREHYVLGALIAGTIALVGAIGEPLISGLPPEANGLAAGLGFWIWCTQIGAAKERIVLRWQINRLRDKLENGK